MTYKQIKNLEEKEFKRLCGVKPKLFDEMVEVLKEESTKGRPRGGQTKLALEDRLLITLEYWREYRTYFHIAQSWGVHESTVCRTVHRIEERLIKSQKFSLPGKKSLSTTTKDWSVIIIDVAESPIERPKKRCAGMGRLQPTTDNCWQHNFQTRKVYGKRTGLSGTRTEFESQPLDNSRRDAG